MASILKQRITRVLKEGPSALLLPLSFRKEGCVYCAVHGDVTWIVDIQGSRWNDTEEAQVTINGGVYVPGVVSRYLRKADPVKPKLVDCCVSVRIGMLSKSKLDTWWTVAASDRAPDDMDTRISAEMRNQVNELLLPFLTKFKSLIDVAEFLDRPISADTHFVAPQAVEQRYAYAGLVYSRIGDNAKSCIAINQAIREAEGKPNEEFIRALSE